MTGAVAGVVGLVGVRGCHCGYGLLTGWSEGKGGTKRGRPRRIRWGRAGAKLISLTSGGAGHKKRSSPGGRAVRSSNINIVIAFCRNVDHGIKTVRALAYHGRPFS